MKSCIFSVVLSTLTLVASVPTPKNSIIIGDYLYFTDISTVLRSRDQAVAYCQSQGAELAKVTDKALYDKLRLALAQPATYWIDGIDKQNHERFAVNNSCRTEELDFKDMPAENLFLPARSCLSLVKGIIASTSRIQASDCIIPNRVLCSFHLTGCVEPEPEPEPTTTMASGDAAF